MQRSWASMGHAEPARAGCGVVGLSVAARTCRRACYDGRRRIRRCAQCCTDGRHRLDGGTASLRFCQPLMQSMIYARTARGIKVDKAERSAGRRVVSPGFGSTMARLRFPVAAPSRTSWREGPISGAMLCFLLGRIQADSDGAEFLPRHWIAVVGPGDDAVDAPPR
jgi:hypothetical protein